MEPSTAAPGGEHYALPASIEIDVLLSDTLFQAQKSTDSPLPMVSPSQQSPHIVARTIGSLRYPMLVLLPEEQVKLYGNVLDHLLGIQLS